MNNEIMKSSYIIMKDNNLIIEVIVGKVNIDDLKTHRDILITDKDFSPFYDVLFYIKDAELEFTSNELENYHNYLFNMKVCEVRKTALLTREKTLEQYSKIYGTMSKEFPVEYKVFTRVEDILDWFNKPNLKLEDILKQMKELKNNPKYQWFLGPNAITGF